MSHHKIEIKDLHYAYPDGHKAISGISFRILHGESVGMIGANGAGKSTLLMLLMGVLSPCEGEVIVGDTRVTKKTLAMIRQRLGMVFQDPDNQLFMTTVYDDVAFGPRNYGLDEKDVGDRVAGALSAVGMDDLKDRAPFRLSAGEKRAASIATVLSMKPDVLIMDEPTASMDPRSRRRLIKLLNGFEHTKIITSHDLDMVSETCSRVIVLKQGAIAADGKVSDILSDAALLESCGLETPSCFRKCPVCGVTAY